MKESRLEVEPAGFGASLAIGEILDPIYDLTERSTDVFITAIVSLGVQKIAYEIGVRFAPPIVGILLFLSLISSCFKNQRAETLNRIFLKSMIFVLLARLYLPVSSLANSFLNDKYFVPEIAEAKQQLSLDSPELTRFKDLTLPEIDGVLGTIQNGYQFAKDKTSDLKVAIRGTIIKMEQLVADLLKLTALYVAMFVVQVVLLPILTFWCLVKIVNSIFDKKYSILIRNSDVFTQTQAKSSKVQS